MKVSDEGSLCHPDHIDGTRNKRYHSQSNDQLIVTMTYKCTIVLEDYSVWCQTIIDDSSDGRNDTGGNRNEGISGDSDTGFTLYDTIMH